MRLLITPALPLSPEEEALLSKEHTLFHIPDERMPLCESAPELDPREIEGIVCNFFFLHNSLDTLPNLRFIQLTSIGLDRVPVGEIREKGITLRNAGTAYATPMAEWAVGKALEIFKCSGFFAENQKNHLWAKNREIRELDGARAVILGFGNVGRRLAERLRAFGVRITAVDVVPDASGLSDRWVHVSQLDDALGEAELLFLTAPLTEETRHILNAHTLSLLPDDAAIINVSRGALIDEAALTGALLAGRFSGVALDVFEHEPLETQSPLWDCDRVIVTPHNSFVGNGNHRRLFEQVCRGLAEFQG